VTPSPWRSRLRRSGCAAISSNASAPNIATSAWRSYSVAMLFRRQETLAKRNWLKTLKGLMAFANLEGIRADNPCAFPLVSALGSADSAADRSALFVGFSATMAKSDFSRACIIGYGSSPPRCGPACMHRRSRRVFSAKAFQDTAEWPLSTRCERQNKRRACRHVRRPRHTLRAIGA
jgi:hypothetical protein